MRLRIAALLAAAFVPTAASAQQPSSLAAAGPTELSWSVGRTYDTLLKVVVRDEWNQELPSVPVTFTAPSSGPTATLSPPSPAVTDEDGIASVTATANATTGVFNVVASVAGVAQTVTFTLLNVAPGLRPGEQLASVFAADEKEKMHNLREFLDGGRSYALIEVCSYCPVCEDSERAMPIAIARLRERRISVNLAPVLILGGDVVAGAAEAQFWKSTIGLKGPVLHVSGRTSSEMYRAAWDIIGIPANVPTTLLVAPDGTIVRRLVGGIGNADAIEALVLRAVLAESPVREATGADVKVALGRASMSGLAAPTLTGPLGSATFFSRIRRPLTDLVEFEFHAGGSLPDAVAHFEISPLWTDGVRRLPEATGVYARYFSVLGETSGELGFTAILSPVSRRNDTFIVDIDVKAARLELAALLVPYVNDGTITQEEADALGQNINGVAFELMLDIDLRLTGSVK